MRVMVTGSREWRSREVIAEALIEIHDATPGSHALVHGDALGADTIAAQVATALGWNVIPLPAREDIYGPWPECGKRRNAALVATRPDVCLAFPMPSSRGTWHAMRLARLAGIPVKMFYAPPAGMQC